MLQSGTADASWRVAIATVWRRIEIALIGDPQIQDVGRHGAGRLRDDLDAVVSGRKSRQRQIDLAEGRARGDRLRREVPHRLTLPVLQPRRDRHAAHPRGA